MLHVISIVVNWRMEWSQYWWHHVIPTPVPVASLNQKSNLYLIVIVLTWGMQWYPSWYISITLHWHQCKRHHITKLHPISTDLVSGMQWCHFDTIGMVWCQHWCQWHHMNKNSCCTSFWSSCLKSAIVSLTMPSALHEASND